MRKSAACGRNVGNLFFQPDTNGAGVLFYLDLNPQQFPLLGVFRLPASGDGGRSKSPEPPSRGYRFASRRAHYSSQRHVGYPRTRPEEKRRIAVEFYRQSKAYGAAFGLTPAESASATEFHSNRLHIVNVAPDQSLIL